MSHANRGKSLEQYIDYINQYYQTRNIALIHKVPTEWSYVNGKFFPKKKSIVDFLGIYHGKAIAFDTKETKISTNFPLSNIHQHQVNYLRQFELLGGLAFYIIHFATHQKIFILTQAKYDHFIKTNKRKSIPYEWFLEHTKEVPYTKLDYLRCLEVKHAN